MYPTLMTINTYRLRLAVDDCIDHGYAIMQGVLWPETASVLAALANKLAFEPSRDLVVPQKFVHAGFYDRDWPDELDWLVCQTEDIVLARARARARIGLMQWSVNDIAIQKYDHTGGIGWHRDFRSDKHLVAIYTVQGTATITLETGRGEKLSYRLEPRTLMLLSGPDPISGNDPRLRHEVGPSLDDEPRISIALRMNLAEHDASWDYEG